MKRPHVRVREKVWCQKWWFWGGGWLSRHGPVVIQIQWTSGDIMERDEASCVSHELG